MESRLSMGNVQVDLTAHPLPDRGRLDVHLGAGNVTLLVPGDADVRVDVTVTAGTIVVDGARAADGLDLAWSNGNAADVVIIVDVGAGQVEVRHD